MQFFFLISLQTDSSHEKDFAKKGKEGESLRKTKRKNPIVWMEIVAKQKVSPYAETALGKVVILLRKDVVPKTAENFLQLCTHKKGKFGFKKRIKHFLATLYFILSLKLS